jgi:hypothetical protein
MKLTKTFYCQFGSEFTPIASVANPTTPPANFPAPSGEYTYGSPPVTGVISVSIPINIPFKVRTIHVKNITYVSGMAGNQGTTIVEGLVSTTCTPNVDFYINILSSLVGNRPVGTVHADSQYSSNTKQDIKHTFLLPQVINGIYDFSIYDNAGSQLAPYQSFEGAPVLPDVGRSYFFFDNFSITMEFNSEYEN